MGLNKTGANGPLQTIAGEHCPDLLHYLTHRRSVARKDLSLPGPSKQELCVILQAASRVSDHGRMHPFWFLVFEGEGKDQFAAELKTCLAADNPQISDEKAATMAQDLMDAPVVIAVISSLRKSKIPAWEQFMTAGAACQNLILAANGLGYGANWLTQWYSYDDRIRQVLKLDETENIAGFFFLGTAEDIPEDRERPDLDQIVTYWHPDNAQVNKGQDYAQAKNISDSPRKGFVISDDFA